MQKILIIISLFFLSFSSLAQLEKQKNEFDNL